MSEPRPVTRAGNELQQAIALAEPDRQKALRLLAIVRPLVRAIEEEAMLRQLERQLQDEEFSRSAGAAPLDVERLAKAILASVSYEPDTSRFVLYEDDGPEELAARLGAEYARHSEGTDR